MKIITNTDRTTWQRRVHKGLWLLAVFSLMLVASSAQADTYYFHNDHLGTPQVLTDVNKTVVWQGEYDPFGKATEVVATVEQNLRFPGQYLDRESGLHYNYFRTYDPATGRYTQSDPIGLIGGINTYGYTYQNPITYMDPLGLWVNVAIGVGVRAFGGKAASVAISRGLKKAAGPVAGTALACVLTGYCSSSGENEDSPGSSESNNQCPPLPEEFQGSNPTEGKGRFTTDSPENETAEEMFGRLTGGTGGSQMPGKPDGQIRGQNGVIYRPPTNGKGARVEIPTNGTRPHESVHWD